MANAMCASFKKEILQSFHMFGTNSPVAHPVSGDVFNIALYTSLTGLDGATTVYTTTNEVPTATGYTAGGKSLTASSGANGTGAAATGYATFTDISWTSATFTTVGALIYNNTQANKAVCVLDFGGSKAVSSGTFTIQFPATTAAVIQIL